MWVILIVVAVILETACENVPMEIRKELNIAMCRYNCLEKNAIQINCNCNENIQDKDWNNEIEELSVDVHCREDDVLALTAKNSSIIFYATEVRTRDDNYWRFYNLTRDRLIVIDTLEENTFYKMRVWGISQEGTIYGSSETAWTRTLPKDYNPQPVSALRLQKFVVENSEYEAVITWDPPEDLSCYFEFVWFGGDDVSDYTQKEITAPSDFRLIIGDLAFGTNYSVAVMTKSPDWQQESAKTWLHFTTLPCLEVYNNLLHCVPPHATGLNVSKVLTATQQNSQYPLYDIELVWDQPKLIPDYYTATFLAFYSKANNSANYANIPGNSTEYVFKGVDPGLHYQITLTAHSAAGASHPAVINQQTSSTTLRKLDVENMFVPFIFVSIAVVLSVSAITFTYLRMTKKTRKERQYFEELELKPAFGDSTYVEEETEKEIYKDEWEIRSCDLLMLSVLGEGAFGVVRKALLTRGSNKTEVAVKMLKEYPHNDEIRQFKQEIDIMKSVGSHPNIVSMVGCCLKCHEGPKLVVEYCAKGDLLTYLRNICDNGTYSLDQEQNSDSSDYKSTGINFSNKAYLMNSSPEDPEETLQMKDLLSIGRQIASGMEYLAGLRVVHRDLAARNVLICTDKTVKVSDFGLSRDVYKDNVYCKMGSGKLPLRWMAIESLTHQRYTTKSDVWSFGILLWEIFTLGGNPYPNIVDMHKLLDSLKAGERMKCPGNCSSEIFSLMLDCWKEQPKDRPTFSDVRKYLDIQLENTALYLNLNVSMTIQSHRPENVYLEN